MAEPIRATVVGAGRISAAWFPALEAEGVEITAVVDLDSAAAERAIAEYRLARAKAFTDLERALALTGSDFVVDLTVPAAHEQVTIHALRAGRHMIGEKPMAESIESAKAMVRTSAETGKLFMVSQSRRWNAGVLDATHGVSAGKIGELVAMRCDFFLRSEFGGYRAEMPHVLLLDMAIHHLDLARKMGGVDPVSVYAEDFNPEGSWASDGIAAHVLFRMTRDIRFSYAGCWSARGQHNSWDGDWRLQGSEGSIHVEQDSRGVAYRSDGGGFLPAPVEIDMAAPQPAAREQRAALREMLAYIREGTEPQSVASDNIKSLAMVCGTVESCETGKPVDIEAMLA